ncbi:2-hydroxyacid dehydrogenase [Moheibacter sediminis]|uniref:Glyoxylate/hydroxypyruvate reductase B n=1 Tax=Moheibacter sediminis TaxID=1434700 RepID=A0A1W1ZB01_9FLAO|nr:D-glycerate dehydrogenase [Moheibacter sediminis]SMC45589.1 Lactate dehydrogenase [Moheibacter sediminis]
MKVFATRKVPKITRELLEQNQIELDEWHENHSITKHELMELIPGYDGIFVMSTQFDREIIEFSSKNIKALSLLSVGFENVDVKAATEFGIPVSNTPDVLSESTADIAFLLMQNVARKAFFNYKRVLDGNWKREFNDHLGFDLSGKTLGVFGLGRIGFVTAKRSKAAFDMNIIYHNRSRNEEVENELNAKYVSFDELLAQSDVISIHSALTPETEMIFNKDAFQKMKNSAVIINTSRGKVIDEKALYEALKSGKIWGAGLDVTDPEPMSADNPLLALENVAVLPHIGSATKETRTAMGKLAVENMILALNGKRMKTPVNPEVYED